uniref:MATA-HMG n=1 Tax=Rhizophagus irregularis TaxID=588596 RepID=A0A1B1EUI5_9GLOM|nr:MATA-HMG [Rhizophagus irregularis]
MKAKEIKLTDYQKFLNFMENPPCDLNIDLDDLFQNIYNNNPYTLYRRNKMIQLRLDGPYAINYKILLVRMWHNEPNEIKEFFKILAIEGNRRFKLRSQMPYYEYYQPQLSSPRSYQTQPQTTQTYEYYQPYQPQPSSTQPQLHETYEYYQPYQPQPSSTQPQLHETYEYYQPYQPQPSSTQPQLHETYEYYQPYQPQPSSTQPQLHETYEYYQPYQPQPSSTQPQTYETYEYYQPYQPQLSSTQPQLQFQPYEANEFYELYDQPPQPLSQPQQLQQPQQQSQPHLLLYPLQLQPQQEEFLQSYIPVDEFRLQSSEQHEQPQLPIDYDFYFY